MDEVFFKDPLFTSLKPSDKIDVSVMEHIKFLAKDASLNMIDKGIDKNLEFLPQFGEHEFSRFDSLEKHNSIAMKLFRTR